MAEGPAIRLDPPGNFNFKEPDSWPKWKAIFTQFRLASGLSTATATRQVSTLLLFRRGRRISFELYGYYYCWRKREL